MEVIEVVEREVEVIEIIERGPQGNVGATGPQANINYIVVSSSQAVSNRQLIAADTSGGSFTLTLPSNPAAGDAIDIFDYSDTFDTNPLTIARNGQNIEGLADDLVANVEGAYFTLIFTGGTRGWQVVPRYGVSGLQNVLTTEGDLLYRGSSAETRLGIGTAGQVLKVNSGATAPEWGNEVMSAADKTKLDGIAAGAEVNVNADWNAVSGDAQILNKPATFTPSSHTHGNITNDGKVGSTSGLPVVTTTDGAVTTLALGTANQVLRVNSGATGVEFGAGFDAASPPAIGNTTPNSGAFTTLTASTVVIGNTNNGLQFANSTTATNGGNTCIIFGGLNGLTTRTRLGISIGNPVSSGTDVSLYSGGSNILEQRSGAAAQTFRLYTTYASGTSFERLSLRGQTTNNFIIATEKGTTGGAARGLEFQVDGTTRFQIASTGRIEFTPAAAGLTPSILINGGNNGDVLTIQDGGLRVQGNAANFTFGNGTYTGVSNVINNWNNNLAILVRRTGGGTGDFIDFQDSSSVSKLKIDKDGYVVLPTSGGVKIGTATNQLLGFYGVTPVDQPALTADLLDSLQELGLVASGSGDTPLNLSGGTLTAGNLVLTDNTGSETATFDAQSKLTANRTYDLPDASGVIALTNQISKTYAVFTATDNQPPATNFMTLDTRNGIAVLDADDATDESAVFVGIIPEGASLGSGLKIRLHWMATTATSGDCVWDVSLERMNTDLDSDSFDTIASGTAAANGTSGILTVTEITLTTIDSVTAGDGYRLKVTRDANNGSDTMTGDAELVVCEVRSAA